MSTATDTWTPADIPDQSGRTVVVTGPTEGGLGWHTGLELARRGARVVLAGRDPGRVDQAAQAVRDQVADADVEVLGLDLSDLSAVRRAAADAERLGPIDALVNNAGVMGTTSQRTADGLELQLATNHFGPFLFTGLLMPQLVASGAARVVAVSSQFHRLARQAPLGDPRRRRLRNRRWQLYAETKLANLLFTYELERRCRAAGLPVQALAAHPGFAGTHLTANGRFGRSAGGAASILDATIRAIGQPAAIGAWPVLMATTAPLPGGTYCGPSGLSEMSGAPQVTTSNALSHDEQAQRRLWEISEEVTGISYPPATV